MKAIYSLVGLKFFDAEPIMRELEPGTTLILRRERANQSDVNAVAVYVSAWSSGEEIAIQVGYVGRGRKPDVPKYEPGDENAPLAARLNAMGDDAQLEGTLVAGWPPKIEVEE